MKLAALFVIAVCGVYALAFLILWRDLRRWIRRPPAPGMLDRPFIRSPLLLMACAGTLCIAWGYFVEAHWIETTRLDLTTSKMKSGDDPIRLLHLTDTHCDDWGVNERKLLAVVAEEDPDLILFSGDACNNPDCGFKAFRRLLEGMRAPHGCYAVRGNWDVWFWPDLDLFEDTPWVELKGDCRLLDVRGTRLAVCGIPYQDAPVTSFPEAPKDAYTVFLYHTPDLIREPGVQAMDLYLAGHTHGGQVCLPFYGALVTLSRYGRAYASGLFREGNTHLYVGRGVGMEGGNAPRVRFACRPEVTVITLRPEP